MCDDVDVSHRSDWFTPHRLTGMVAAPGRRFSQVKTLEIRRHSLTKKGRARERGSLLSPDGVRRARQMGDSLPNVRYVLTGPDRRHIETAIAMGYAVDETVDCRPGTSPAWSSTMTNGDGTSRS
jgi:hypothetical protein